MADVNAQIGGYKLRAMLQTSQFTQVFECVEPLSNRHFAMKVLLPEHADNKEQRRVLFSEAEIGTKLRHENIIQIVKVDKSETSPFFIMEYFPAGSLRKRMFEKDFTFIKDHSSKIFKQMATGLAYMHGSGYVHCDIKPDNILVNAIGELKLIDFAISKKIPTGFAKWFYRKQKAQGTRTFMSPEQLKGEKLDGRADIYSFGATMYELLTTRKPFTGTSMTDLENKIAYAKPEAPQMHNKDLTDDINNLILRMMQKDKTMRPTNCHEVMIELRKIRIFKTQKKTEKN